MAPGFGRGSVASGLGVLAYLAAVLTLRIAIGDWNQRQSTETVPGLASHRIDHVHQVRVPFHDPDSPRCHINANLSSPGRVLRRDGPRFRPGVCRVTMETDANLLAV